MAVNNSLNQPSSSPSTTSSSSHQAQDELWLILTFGAVILPTAAVMTAAAWHFRRHVEVRVNQNLLLG